MSKRIIFILFIFIIFSITLNTFYRPYIISHKIDDFGISDIGNNFFFIPIVYLLIFWTRKKFIFGKSKDILFHFTFLTFYECLSYFVNFFGVFDVKDIFGLLIGAFLTKYISNEYFSKDII